MSVFLNNHTCISKSGVRISESSLFSVSISKCGVRPHCLPDLLRARSRPLCACLPRYSSSSSSTKSRSSSSPIRKSLSSASSRTTTPTLHRVCTRRAELQTLLFFFFLLVHKTLAVMACTFMDSKYS